MPSKAEDGSAAPPALFEHCQNAYRAMLGQAKVVVGSKLAEDHLLKTSDDFVEQVVVYEGFLTHLITQELSLSVPYYTTVRKALTNMGCIRQLRRGGGTSPSQWEMITEPTLEAFMNQVEDKKPAQSRESAATAQILALNNRVSELETTVEEIVAAWAKFFGAQEVKDS